MFSVIMLWAASIDGQLSSLVACHCTDLYLFNLFVHLANKFSLSLEQWQDIVIATVFRRIEQCGLQFGGKTAVKPLFVLVSADSECTDGSWP